jgi:hypothetical protein
MSSPEVPNGSAEIVAVAAPQREVIDPKASGAVWTSDWGRSMTSRSHVPQPNRDASRAAKLSDSVSPVQPEFFLEEIDQRVGAGYR